MCGRRGELCLQENTEGFLAQHLVLQVPVIDPMLTIFKATYGHPQGAAKYDVTDQIVGISDQLGSHYLDIPASTDFNQLFGDPCYGVDKEIMIKYDVRGRSGEAKQYEHKGHLNRSIVINATPIVAPVLLIEKAYYGFSPKDIERRINEIKMELTQLEFIQMQQNSNLQVSAAHLEKLSLQPGLAKELEMLSNLKNASVDITAALQRLVDKARGDRIVLGLHDNANQLFGDPCPGYHKWIDIAYHVTGLGTS